MDGDQGGPEKSWLAPLTWMAPARAHESGPRPDRREVAAENPHTYDARDWTRRALCVPILPGTNERLRLVKRQAKLRTLAGAWEFLSRLGLAAVDRLTHRI